MSTIPLLPDVRCPLLPSLSVTVRHCPLLAVTVRYCPLRCYPLLSTLHYGRLSVTVGCPLLSAVSYCQLSVTVCGRY